MIIEILFITSILLYVVYSFAERDYSRLDYDLLNSMGLIATSLEEGDSLESTLAELAKGNDKAARLYGRVMKEVKLGSTLSEAFEKIREKNTSKIFDYLTKMVSAYEKSDQDIAQELIEFKERMLELENTEKELYAKTKTSVMVIQIVAIFIAPFACIFLSGILQFPMYAGAYIFLMLAVLIFSMLDLFVYSDGIKTVFLVPIFLTGYLLVITRLAPFITLFFLEIF
jgi:Flp pilus assembly protein TadB